MINEDFIEMTDKEFVDKLLSPSYNKETIWNVDFSKIGRIHDWRNYVPDIIRGNWKTLTTREKALIFHMAEIQAHEEEWD